MGADHSKKNQKHVAGPAAAQDTEGDQHDTCYRTTMMGFLSSSHHRGWGCRDEDEDNEDDDEIETSWGHLTWTNMFEPQRSSGISIYFPLPDSTTSPLRESRGLTLGHPVGRMPLLVQSEIVSIKWLH